MLNRFKIHFKWHWLKNALLHTEENAQKWNNHRNGKKRKNGCKDIKQQIVKSISPMSVDQTEHAAQTFHANEIEFYAKVKKYAVFVENATVRLFSAQLSHLKTGQKQIQFFARQAETLPDHMIGQNSVEHVNSLAQWGICF